MCEICQGRKVVFTQNDRGEPVAHPCSCVKAESAAAYIKKLVDAGSLADRPHYHGDCRYTGPDAANKASLLRDIGQHRRVWLWGPAKTQKTTFAVSVLRELAGIGKFAQYITMGDLNRSLFGAGSFDRTTEESKEVERLRQVPVLIIDDVYDLSLMTFGTGIHVTYWLDFVASRKLQTIFVSRYHPSSPPMAWIGNQPMNVEDMRIEEFGVPYDNVKGPVITPGGFTGRRRVVSEG